MNKQNLELLGLSEGATLEQVEEAYKTMRAQLLEDRFLDGEAGNEAAKKLTKIQVAYDELLSEFAGFGKGESAAADGDGSSCGTAYSRVEELIKSGDLSEAQRVLDTFNERGAQWHYLQSVVFYRKNWINESKKQLEIAMRLDGENRKYKEAYEKLNEKIAYDANSQGAASGGEQSAYRGQDMNNAYSDNQMGGSFCASCVECCALNACINCLCNGCCH
ncbi:MAG: J domain-containing protein [Muribaculaceae bacterium]|nr:J domain-containing protein [Muribaculaceae bacterium]